MKIGNAELARVYRNTLLGLGADPSLADSVFESLDGARDSRKFRRAFEEANAHIQDLATRRTPT